jgi:hypothetical protein
MLVKIAQAFSHQDLGYPGLPVYFKNIHACFSLEGRSQDVIHGTVHLLDLLDQSFKFSEREKLFIIAKSFFRMSVHLDHDAVTPCSYSSEAHPLNQACPACGVRGIDDHRKVSDLFDGWNDTQI